ncbi:MAG: efflux RND transporter periplasmic adaptor subunit [Bacteroidia bacterium]|nr:efflux RND transporter periplasmic adaptor subunit [Bacteroidia bacterium]MCX7763815.1 efflux RND transporter periplasmic adaptor subunit [Bacteroidia bacterium]MDW8056649.1 efflux RND transporter periplasmic adaptor subunit [Bacteroidia bacterium]
MRRWQWLLLIGIGLLLLFGVGRWACGGDGALTVEVDTLRRRTIRPFITETAVIRPVVEVPISPDVSGEVVRIYVKEGDTVKAGQLLFTIRPDNYRMALLQMQAALEEAKAQYASAQAALAQQAAAFIQESLAYERAKRLYEGRALSEAEWDAARLRYQISQAQRQSAENSVRAAFHRIRSVQANLDRTKLDYERTSVYASMDGVITRLLVRVGQRVVGVGQMAGTESVRIADLSRFLVETQISENDVVRLHVGDSVSIEVQAYPELKLRGYVQQIGYSSGRASPQSEAASALAGEQVSTYLVRIAIDTSGYDPKKYPLRPDMSALVRIYYAKRENVLTLPLQAIVLRRGEEVVYEVREGKAIERKVRSGLADDKWVEVEGELQEGALIVTGPYEVLQERLRDSVEVSIRSRL